MNKKILIISIIVASVFLFLVIKQDKSQVEYQEPENVNLAIYLNETETSSIPSKEGNVFDEEKSTCTNEAYIVWDYSSWSPIIKNVSNYPVRCNLYFKTEYSESILNGTDPILKDELIPVTISDDGTVRKADLGSKWYSYAEQKWANAVITQNSYDALTNNGDVHGVTKNDGYVSLDGVDDYINLGLENYDFGNEITLMAKVKINDYLPSQSAGVIVGNHDASGATLNFGNNGNINYMQLAVHINEGYINVATPYETGKWYTMVGTYDGNIAKLYINGELASQVEVEGKITISLMPFLIGANPQSDNIPIEHSNVDIKKIAIYKRALSAEEIKESASSEIKVVDDTGLLRYVDFTNKTNYKATEVIPEENIESYFVWIPKYRYQLWDLGLYDSLTSIDTNKVHEIPVIFGDYNTSDNIEGECTTPMESGATRNCNIGDYMTHPAFLSIPSKGFWVGKFETGYEGATSTEEAEVNERDASKIIVKPNVYSWRGIQVANAFYSSYDYKRNLDSHMMKNTEWGAVAYLQHSKYGSKTSVRLNNNSDYITGYQANNEPTCGYTETNEECNRYCNDKSCNVSYPNSILASTTNNISGIFDMSGGAWEHTMGFILDENGQPMSGKNSLYNSGFNGAFGCPTCDNDTSGIIELTNGYNFPDSKYFEKYQYSATGGQFQKRILGDATGEMGPFLDITNTQDRRVPGSWYNDHSSFATASLPTFFYGNSWAQGHYTGMFAFGSNDGRNARYISFRLILTPT